MTVVPHAIERRILHVASVTGIGSGATLTTAVEQWLAESAAPTERVGDVYRALSRVLRQDRTRLGGVVVCLDVVGAAEMEFFAIVSRLRPDLKVYVYSNSPADSRTAQAVQYGATGPASRVALQALGGAARPSAGEPARVPPTVASAPIELQEEGPEEELPPDADGEEPLTDGDAEPAVRVPWLRYEDQPARTAPTRHGPPAPVAETAPDQDDAYEPLLTEAELQALMSDDVSTIAPHEPRGWNRDEPASQGGP